MDGGAMDNGDLLYPGSGLAPEAVEEIDFATVRRGFEPGPVRNRLRGAADEIRRLNALIVSLSERIAEMEATPPAELESHRVAEALGDEAARFLQAARDAAQERIERAEAEYNEMTGKARAAAAAIVEESRVAGREMVVEARNVRERILADLARKRHEHRVEVEQLRVIHARLLEALAICREGLDGWVEKLMRAEPQAAAAAENAGLRVAAEPEQTVSEIEAEIEAARMVGIPLDRPPEPTESDDGRAAHAHAEPDEAEAAEEVAAPSDDADGAYDSELALEELDELEELDGYVEIVGYAGQSSATPAPVGLYDIEAESDTDPGLGEAPEPGGAGPPAVAEAPAPVGEPAAELDADAIESDAEAIFARLRLITSQPLHESAAPPQEAQPPTEPTTAQLDTAEAELATAQLDKAEAEFATAQLDNAEAELATAQLDKAEAEPTEAIEPELAEATEPEPVEEDPVAVAAIEPEPVEEDPVAVEPPEPDDLVSAARAVAVGGIARRLKRLVVDEQSDLLDAIRRNGTRAVRGAITADTAVYARAARTPLQDFASDIDVSIDDIDLRAAGDAIVSVMVEPVRARLSELLEETEDLDELTSAVRSIYRESRSRRAESAAEGAFAAGWSEPVS